MLKITASLRSTLRAQAHSKHPIVLIGDAGLSPAVLREIDLGLTAHGLIKVRVFDNDRKKRVALYDTICEKLAAAPVQHIGKLLVLYRPTSPTKDETQG